MTRPRQDRRCRTPLPAERQTNTPASSTRPALPRVAVRPCAEIAMSARDSILGATGADGWSIPALRGSIQDQEHHQTSMSHKRGPSRSDGPLLTCSFTGRWIYFNFQLNLKRNSTTPGDQLVRSASRPLQPRATNHWQSTGHTARSLAALLKGSVCPWTSHLHPALKPTPRPRTLGLRSPHVHPSAHPVHISPGTPGKPQVREGTPMRPPKAPPKTFPQVRAGKADESACTPGYLHGPLHASGRDQRSAIGCPPKGMGRGPLAPHA